MHGSQPGEGNLQVIGRFNLESYFYLVQLFLFCLSNGHGLPTFGGSWSPCLQLLVDPARLLLPILPLRQAALQGGQDVRKGCIWPQHSYT